MELWLLLGTTLLAFVLSGVAGHRGSLVATAVAALSVWWWLFAAGLIAGWCAPVLPVAAFAGAFAACTLQFGWAEDNAVPRESLRRWVLAHHRVAVVRYPAEPRGKRLFDVVVAVAALVLTLPLCLVISVLIWLEEPAPVLFMKNSVGRGGVTFRQLKFRSMRYRAEEDTGPVVSCPDDPRTLRVGRWLRRWHLDEIPELLNVLVGQMSLVGPRPLRTVLVADYLVQVPGFAQRHSVRPGIACTAQIERYRMPPWERLSKDRAYIRRIGVRTDVVLLARAVLTTARGVRERVEAGDERVPGRCIPIKRAREAVPGARVS